MGFFRVAKISSNATNQVSHDKASTETTPNWYVSRFRDSPADANIKGKNSVSFTSLTFESWVSRQFPLLLFGLAIVRGEVNKVALHYFFKVSVFFPFLCGFILCTSPFPIVIPIETQIRRSSNLSRLKLALVRYDPIRSNYNCYQGDRNLSLARNLPHQLLAQRLQLRKFFRRL